MKLGAVRQGHRIPGQNHSERGFSLLEMIFVVLIGIILTIIALPLIGNVMGTYRLRAGVASVAGAIQTTRFQAISSGYAYQVVFNKAASTIQVQSDPGRTGVFANVGNTVPLSNSGIPVILGADTTLQFRPSGLVTATVGATALTLTYRGMTETITVSNYGNVKVTP